MRSIGLVGLGVILVSGVVPKPGVGNQATGTLAPSGPPLEPPVRVSAGDGCVVDLKQPYSLTGTLTGSTTIDYRIFVDGRCGVPAGTFREHWIAHGAFEGVMSGDSVSTSFSYVAEVSAGGGVEGVIVLEGGTGLELRVTGNLQEDRLIYEARAR